MDNSSNFIRLCGSPTGRPQFSHMTHEGAVYVFPLTVERLSGTEDVINVEALRDELKNVELTGGENLAVTGEVCSFNNRSGKGPKLVITVRARTMEFTDAEHDNVAELTGTICKTPVFRRTPMGREICDIMLAVNRKAGRSDYIPCIAWGQLAEEAREWSVGTEVDILGRLQSRRYIKNENDLPVEKVAYEVSVVNIKKHE